MVKVDVTSLQFRKYLFSLCSVWVTVILKSSMQAVKQICHMICIHCVPVILVNKSLQKRSREVVDEWNGSNLGYMWKLSLESIFAFIWRELFKPIKNFPVGCKWPENEISRVQNSLEFIFRVGKVCVFVNILVEYEHKKALKKAVKQVLEILSRKNRFRV